MMVEQAGTPVATVTVAPTVVADDRGGDAPPAPELATIDPDRYRDRCPLTQGGMGAVSTARDRRLGRRVAIKELITSTPSLRSRFEREALLTARLEHPSIVTVHEAGRWPSGEPFYAMRLVHGRSLDQCLALAPSLAGRLALLANVIAVADAVAYAHEHRIIHRDLKPRNVIVGEFGETVVIDWGLAKDLDGDDLAAGPDTPVVGETVAGSVLGTPRYMPPEQARGEPADERADVYAIGALLYHVLAGAPPYEAVRAESTLDAVRAGPPDPVNRRERHLPPDLVAIVERAMARDPRDRYASGRAIADELRRFQTGQLVGAYRYSRVELIRRWIGRHRAVVAAAAIAAVVIAALSVIGVRRILDERDLATAQHELSEVHRGEADDMVGFVVSDLANQLDDVGRIDLVEQPARKAVDYYDRVASRGEPVGIGAVIAHRKLGEALAVKGKLAPAIAELRSALTGVQPAGASLDHDRERIELHYKLGQFVQLQGDAAAALALFRDALALAQRRLAAYPDDPRLRFGDGFSHTRIGIVLEQTGDLPGALVEYTAALRSYDALVKAHPEHPRGLAGLADAQGRLGDVARARGDVRGALASYAAAVASARTVVAGSPNPRRRWELIFAMAKLATAELASGNAQAALDRNREMVELAEQMVASDPSNKQWQRDLAVLELRVGDAQVKLGHRDEAIALFQRSLATRRRLLDLDPMNLERQHDVAVAAERIGEQALDRGELATARDSFEANLAIYRQLAARDPSNADHVEAIAITEGKLEELASKQRDTGAALRHARAMLDLMMSLGARDPSNLSRQASTALAHESVARHLAEQRRFADALAAYGLANVIRTSLVAASPANPELKRALAEDHAAIAEVQRQVGQGAAAAASLRAALRLIDSLGADADRRDRDRAAELRQSLASPARIFH